MQHGFMQERNAHDALARPTLPQLPDPTRLQTRPPLQCYDEATLLRRVARRSTRMVTVDVRAM